MATAVKGYRELATAFAKSDKQVKKGFRLVMAEAAEPVEREITSLARQRIRRVGDRWSEMRTGVTRTLVYIVPKKRGTKIEARRRPNFGVLMFDRAMEPGLRKHEADIEHAVERALDRLANEFNRGGPIR